MRIGVFLLAAGFPGVSREQSVRNALAYGIAAESAGFDDVFMAEHHFLGYGACPSALTFAALLAGRTTRIGVGTAVSVLSTAHPVAVAEQAALLDVLTGGRFTLGVGRGGPWVDLEVFGGGTEALSPRAFAEAVDVITAWLSQDSVSYDGEFHRFREVPVVPRGRPPLLVACTSAASATLAARHGLPMLLGMHATDGEKREMVDGYAAQAAAVGTDAAGSGPAHAAVLVAQVAPSRAEGVSLLRRTLPAWLGPGLAGHVRFDRAPAKTRDPDAYAAFLAEQHPVGDPDHVVGRVAESCQASGVRRVLFFVEGGGPERTLANITALGRDVLPRLRAGVR